MRALIFQPNSMRTRCFASADLDRLASVYRVTVPDTDDAQQLVDDWPALAEQADVVVTGWGTPQITDAMLTQASRLRFILHAAGSIKHVVPSSVWDRNIRVASCNEALGICVAEATLGMIIAGVKGFFPANALTHSGGWKTNDTDLPNYTVRELYELTIGIIGASQTGRHLVRLLQAFETKVLVFDPYLSPQEAGRLGVERVELDELMRRSDVVSLHAPALPQTRKMLGRKQFGAMKDDAIFINTARGMIVDEVALAEELRTGRIWAFIDVTEAEPPARDHPFRRLPNVVLTPHIAGATSNGCRRLGRSAVEQLLQYAQGQPICGEVTAERLPILA